MARLNQAFLGDSTPQRLPSDARLAGRGGATSIQQRQWHGAGQRPIYVVCKASYPGNGMYSNRICEAQVSVLGNILQEALNAIVGGPGGDGISSGYWDVEHELKKFEESLTILARRVRDSVTLAQLRLEKREEENAEGVSSKKPLGESGDGQGEGGSGESDIGPKSEARDSQRSRKSKMLRLWAGEDESDLSFLPAQAPPVVERVEKPLADLEPCHRVLDAVVEDTESGGEGFVGESERKRQQHIGTKNTSGPGRPTPVRPGSPAMPGLYAQPFGITDSPESSTSACPGELPQDGDGPTSPIIARIDELLSDLIASASPPAAEDKNENAEPKGFKPPSVLNLESHPSHRSTEESEYRPSVSPPPLAIPAKGEEKPLPSLPPFSDYDYSSSLQSVDGGSQTESEDIELLPTPPLDSTNPPSAAGVSPYILRNSLPEQRSSREALEAYARAVEDVHGIRRVGSPFGNDDSGDDSDSEEGGSKRGSRANALATGTTKGPPLNVPSSDTTGEIRVPGSAHPGDGGEKGVVEKTKPAKVSAGESQERLRRRWTSLRRGGGPTWKTKGVRSGIRGFSGVGV